MTMGRPPLEPGSYRPDISARQQKSGIWRVRATVRRFDGTTIQVEGRGRTKREAEAKFRERAEARLGDRHTSSSTITPDSTVAELVLVWADYVDARVIGTDGTRHEDRRLIRNHINPHFSRLRIREVRGQAVLAWYEDLEKGLNSTANKCLSILRRAFKHGMLLEVIDRNPAASITRTRRELKEINAPGAMELSDFRDKIVEYMERPNIMGPKPTRDLLDYVDIILGTGARPGEACGLRWSDIDLESTPARVSITGQVQEGKGQKKRRVSHTKTRSGLRTINIPDATAVVLRDRRREQPHTVYVFETRTLEPTGPQQFNLRMRKVREFAGLSDELVPYALRKSAITAIADESGIEAAALYAGHARSSVTERHYAKRNRDVDNLTDALQKLAPSQRKALLDDLLRAAEEGSETDS